MFFCLFVFEIIISCGAGIRLKHKKSSRYVYYNKKFRNREIVKEEEEKNVYTTTQDRDQKCIRFLVHLPSASVSVLFATALFSSPSSSSS